MKRAFENGDARGRVWVGGSLALILLATLTPQIGSPNLGQDFFVLPVPGAIGTGRDILQNVVLYVPLGLALGLRGHKWPRAILAAAILSLATELCQFLIPGRDPVASDVAVNVAGANIGWAITTWPRFRSVARAGIATVEQWLTGALRPEPRAAAKLSLVWAGVVSVIVASTFWLLSPAIPEPFYYLVSTPLMDVVPGPLRIGGDGTPTGLFSGLIDEVRIYSSVRTEESIRADMGRSVINSSSEPGLVAAYGFDADEADRTTDATDRRRAGKLHGVNWTPFGRFGGALAFDGRASEVIVPDFPELDLRQAMTIEAWTKPTGRQRGSATVVTQAGGAYFLRASSRSGALSPSGGGRFGENPREARQRRRVPANEWTHLATTYDGQAITLYVNGRKSVRLLQWSPHNPLTMSLDDLDLTPGFVPSPSNVRSLLSGPFTLRIAVSCGLLQREAAPMFALVGVQSQEVLTVDVSGSDLHIRSSQQARRIGLTPVEYRVPDALSRCLPGQTRSFAVKGPMQVLNVEDDEGRVMRGIGPGVGSGWALLLDARTLPVWLVITLSTGYLALIALPFGYWARVGMPSMIGALLVLGTLWVAPGVWGAAGVGSLQGAGIIAGVLSGALLSRAASHEHGLDGLQHNEGVEGQ